MLDKMQTREIFLGSKWVVKQWRQLATSTTHLAQELLMNIQCRGASSFAKETRALKMRSVVTSHWSWQWPTESHHQSWSSYNYTRSCLRTQHQPFYGHSAFAANGKEWKCSTNGCLRSWLKIEKLSLYSMQQQWTISQSNCNVWRKVDFMWNQQWPAQWLDQEEVPKHFPKPNLHQKEVMVSFWFSATHLIHYSFLNPGETITSVK